MNHTDIPVFILTQDRRSCLDILITRLETDGMRNLYILDTGSTYPPMVEYLKRVQYPVVPCDMKNRRAPKFALWDCDVLQRTKNLDRHFLYTDGDVVPDYDCPSDWAKYLLELLAKYPKQPKAGLGLRLNDLPDCYAYKGDVLKHEAALWQKSVGPHLFDSQLDTTLALYAPGTPHRYHCLRTGGKYLIRHLPWYYNTANLPEEERYYLDHMHGHASYWARRDWPKHRHPKK